MCVYARALARVRALACVHARARANLVGGELAGGADKPGPYLRVAAAHQQLQAGPGLRISRASARTHARTDARTQTQTQAGT